MIFNPKNLKVSKTVWEHHEGYWNARAGESVPEWVEEKMNRVSVYAAQEMECRRIHGFAYSSQLWPELEPVLPFTNSLVLVGLNPFEIGHDLFQIEEGIGADQLIPIRDTNINLAHLIPGLNKSAPSLHDEINYLQDEAIVWSSHLFGIGRNTVKRALQSTVKHLHIDHGFLSWDDYQEQVLEDVSCENFDVRPTGLIRELYWDVIRIDYELVSRVGVENHPVFGDIYGYAVETLSSQHFFRQFLVRMFGAEQPADE